MTDDELKPLGVNVPYYLEAKGYDERQTKQILARANEMAKVRRTKIIHLDFVMVSDGSIRENQMGGTLVWQTRRALRRQRLGAPVGHAVPPPQAKVRPRKKRPKAGE